MPHIKRIAQSPDPDHNRKIEDAVEKRNRLGEDNRCQDRHERKALEGKPPGILEIAVAKGKGCQHDGDRDEEHGLSGHERDQAAAPVKLRQAGKDRAEGDGIEPCF
ncbi:hypothetical protein D3C73_759890 [compost metagenome]